MVKETQATVFQCEKCGKRFFSKYDIGNHEKGCGMGVQVKPGDLVIYSWTGSGYQMKRVASISGKTVYVSDEDGSHPRPVDYDPPHLKVYDEQGWNQLISSLIETIHHQTTRYQTTPYRTMPNRT